ncbi:MAG TPA: class II aldolase/adducin family protein [candidate division Zixibacteria bacterium]|nr:class II aldolase/adducin family protein [candidate division Zixibacteria bacterium]
MSRPAPDLPVPERQAAGEPVIVHRTARTAPSGVAVVGDVHDGMVRWFVEGVTERLERRGHPVYRPDGRDAQTIADDVRVILNAVDAANPQSFRRRSKDIFVVGLAELPDRPNDMLQAGYTLLVRSLSNVFIPMVRNGGVPEAHFITMEQGFHGFHHDGDDDAFFSEVVERLVPLAESRLVIDNEFIPDLPEELWNGDEHTEAIYRAGLRMKELDLLPAPWPIDELLSPEDLRHVKRLFGLGGLSYGNASVRHDGDRFWMSASGVDKSHLRQVGTEILLVTGYDPATGVVRLSVPPNVTPRRVSVDAIEHLTIYREHPEVGAILHVHGWLPGAPSTEVVYPCGTEELALEVAELVRAAPDPAQAVVGLKNHGLTITGHSMDDILERVGPHIVRRVPMD